LPYMYRHYAGFNQAGCHGHARAAWLIELCTARGQYSNDEVLRQNTFASGPQTLLDGLRTWYLGGACTACLPQTSISHAAPRPLPSKTPLPVVPPAINSTAPSTPPPGRGGDKSTCGKEIFQQRPIWLPLQAGAWRSRWPAHACSHACCPYCCWRVRARPKIELLHRATIL
jgi:hypothetical protein